MDNSLNNPTKSSLNELISDPINVWSVIDTYFRDNTYYKSQHQLDSFNEFIYSKINGIQHIIKRGNPLMIYKEALNPDATQYKYEIEIYFGETLDEKGGIIPNIENIFVSSPNEYTEERSKYMYPNIARLKGYTYKSNIFCNIAVKYTDNEKNKITIKNFEKVDIGAIPIMVHSKRCVLHNLDHVKLSELGECPYDQGGYFIINGKEKVVISQEKKVNNILYINSSFEPGVILEANIKSISNEGFQSSRTNMVSLMEKKININDKYTVPRILVRILGFDNRIPICILFRALGVESDKHIFSLIKNDNDDPKLSLKLNELFHYSIRDAQPVYTQRDALKLLATLTKGKDIINVIDILNNNFIPHYTTYNEKSTFLGYVVRQLLLTRVGAINQTDRDSYANKRIDLAGSLLLELYRELWANFQRSCSLKIDHEYKFNFKEGYDFSEIIHEQNQKRIFDNKSMNSIVRSFGAAFGTGVSARKGIVQELNRLSMLGTLSNIRRLCYPLPAGSKSIGPRKLHNSQWGFVCPSESPDGANVGIINHLTIVAQVSSNIETGGIYEALLDFGVVPLISIIPKDLSNLCKVFLNGKLLGLHNNPPLLKKIMRLLKLNSIINCLTSIVWDTELNEIQIFCDSGRIVRPVFSLKDDQSNALLAGDLTLLSSWKKATHGYMHSIKGDNISITTNDYFKEELNDIKEKNLDFIKFLEENQSVIEYIDPYESNYALIARDYRSIDKAYTHCEIHSSLILSAVTLNIPFPEHSQAPRNVFSSQQTKQAVGVYTSAYNTRFDTFAHVLHYPQKSIVTTKYKKYTDVDKLPYGVNCIVAIASYSGYNQEDAVILNKTSVQRGMFQSVYFRSYQDSEEVNNGTMTYFGNPKNQSNIKKSNLSKFSKLDENGFVKENEYVTADDAIIGKCTKKEGDKGSYTDVFGTSVKFGTSGTVDKVIIYENKDSLRTCKVRIRKIKIPDIGDKFSSRPGQKGVCGMLLEEKDMPFTKEGIVPDLIVNPHAIPSRMTINQLLEMVLGKSCCLSGNLGDATPFQNNDINDYTKLLESYGYEGKGNEIMYSGITGDQLKTSIFIGPIYYQRLKIMVADKMHSRATGPVQALIRQPASGRANNGGLRIGEMERDSILSHGLSRFLGESVMERSDKYKVQINEATGLIDYSNDNSKKSFISVPYAMKMLLQELQAMSIYPRIQVNDTIENPAVFKYLIDNVVR